MCIHLWQGLWHDQPGNQIALFRTKRGQTSDVFNEAAHLEKPFLNCGSHGIGFSVLDFVAWAWAAPG